MGMYSVNTCSNHDITVPHSFHMHPLPRHVHRGMATERAHDMTLPHSFHMGRQPGGMATNSSSENAYAFGIPLFSPVSAYDRPDCDIHTDIHTHTHTQSSLGTGAASFLLHGHAQTAMTRMHTSVAVPVCSRLWISSARRGSLQWFSVCPSGSHLHGDCSASCVHAYGSVLHGMHACMSQLPCFYLTCMAACRGLCAPSVSTPDTTA